MKFRFENLQVWQDARNFVNHIYSITKRFPTDERFGLIDQLRRAAVSIALNIAEGSDRKSDIEFRRYLRMSITSTEEVVTALFIALDQKYLNQIDFDKLYEEAHMIVAKLNALINKLTDYSLPSTAKGCSRKTEV
ncbi:MAG: four helix bundle protein [Candidatus Daviesbacteria bacterium]|nr:four helix bundle protein [Candidatus Daviesbacteria bacterium]